MKVIHYKSTFPELTENWLYNQINGLDKDLSKVYAIERGNTTDYPFDNIRCLREDTGCLPLFFDRMWHKFFAWHPQFLLWFREDRPALIHAHFGICGYEVLPCAKWLDIPLITSFYGCDAYKMPKVDPSWYDKYEKLFKYGRLFLVEGPAMQEKLIELGCPAEKIIIHHIGIKLKNYKFCVRKPGNEVRLLISGRFVEKKGIPYAIEALNLLRSKTLAKVHLTIVGDSDKKGTVTEEKRKILDSINRHNLAESVTITGFVSHNQLMKIACDHHICLIPSVHSSDGDAEGGFPVVLTEMLATGMPVVAFDHCDIPHIVQNGKSGFIVSERDTAGFAEKLAYMIEHPQILREMGQAGRNFVENQYDIDKLNNRLTEIYHSLLNGNS